MAYVIARAVQRYYLISLEQGQAKYRFYFIKNASRFAPYQEECDNLLNSWSCRTAIVTE